MSSATTVIPNSTAVAPPLSPNDDVITAELLLAIIVPVTLILCVGGIACFRYFQKNGDVLHHDERLIKGGFEPADGPIGLDASWPGRSRRGNVGGVGAGGENYQDATRLGLRTDTSSINTDDQNCNCIVDRQNGYFDEGSGEYFYRDEDRFASSVTYGDNNNRSSPPSQQQHQQQSKQGDVRLTPRRWKDIKRFDSNSSSETSDDSQLRTSKLPPAPGEAAIINPFGRANVHQRTSTTSPSSASKRPLSPSRPSGASLKDLGLTDL